MGRVRQPSDHVGEALSTEEIHGKVVDEMKKGLGVLQSCKIVSSLTGYSLPVCKNAYYSWTYKSEKVAHHCHRNCTLTSVEEDMILSFLRTHDKEEGAVSATKLLLIASVLLDKNPGELKRGWARSFIKRHSSAFSPKKSINRPKHVILSDNDKQMLERFKMEMKKQP